MDDPADAAALERAGRAAFPGFELHRPASVGSTQDEVRAAARAGADEGYCCLAAVQTAGRGRQDRTWEAAAGTALLCSILVRVRHPVLGGVPLAAGLAIRAAIERTAGVRCRLKWPNDVLTGGGKVAGVLCEVEPHALGGDRLAVALGFGINLTVAAFPPGSAGVSLDRAAGRSAPVRTLLLAAVLDELSRRLAILDEGFLAPLRDEWMEHAAGIGELVTAVSAAGAVTGTAEGLDDDGALLVRTGAGLVRVLAGDVHIGLPPPPRGS